MGSTLPLIAIYLYTKFYLNGNSSFKVISGQGTRTDGQSGDYMLPPSESIKMATVMLQNINNQIICHHLLI